MNNDLLDNDLLDDIKPVKTAKTVAKKALSAHGKIQRVVFYATIVKWAIGGFLVISLACVAYWAATNAKDIVTDAKLDAVVDVAAADARIASRGWGDKLKSLSVKVVSEIEEYKKDIATGEEIPLHDYEWAKFAWAGVCPKSYGKLKEFLNANGKVTESQYSTLTGSCGTEAEQGNIERDRIEADKVKQEILGE